MKKTILTILFTLLTCAVFAQIPKAVKFNNANFIGGIWVRDSIFCTKLVVDDMVYPTAVGDAGYVLKSDGYRGTYWDSITTTPSYWNKVGNTLSPITSSHINSAYSYYMDGVPVLSDSNSSLTIGKLAVNAYPAGTYNVCVGRNSYIGANTNYSTMINGAGYGSENGDYNIGIGRSAYVLSTGSNNIGIGYGAMQLSTSSYTYGIGVLAGYSNTNQSWFYIGAGDTTTSVFNGCHGYNGYTKRLHLNGKIQINNAYWLPTTDGSTGYGLGTDGSGIAGWYRYLGFSDTSTIATKSYATNAFQPKGTYYTASDTASTLLTRSKANTLYGDDYAHINITTTALATITDGATYYFGNIAASMGTAANTYYRIYFNKEGTITAADICFVSGNAVGTNENITMYIRKNNTTDYEILTVGNTDRQRRFVNSALSIPINGTTDYIEIKLVCPTWATNPSTVSASGYLTIKY